MKSAYELAMERLSKQTPTVKLTDAQKKEISELESLYVSKIAERELATKREMDEAADKSDFETMLKADQRLAADKKKFLAELEAKKEAVRQRKK